MNRTIPENATVWMRFSLSSLVFSWAPCHPAGEVRAYNIQGSNAKSKGSAESGELRSDPNSFRIIAYYLQEVRMDNVLKVTGLKKFYGGLEALKGIVFEVGKGEIFHLIGPNAAGKTTALRL